GDNAYQKQCYEKDAILANFSIPVDSQHHN
ncbi:unnamed protein product, partial [marine sediment metagenome]